MERELVEVDVDVSFMDDSVRDSVVDEMLNSILNDVDNSVIPWWTRRLTSSIILSCAWSAGDMEKKGGKARRVMQDRRGRWVTWWQCSSR